MIRTRYDDIPAYRTKDRSLIRELMHPLQHGNVKQSLAEARIAPGAATLPHRHYATEELYHVIAGSGVMYLGTDSCELAPGDTLCIPPGTRHWVENRGQDELVILCCCSPPYDHADTLLEVSTEKA